MQRERLKNPYPWTWEIPAILIGVTLFFAVVGIQLARSLANLLAGAGWTWPTADTGAFSSPFGSAFWTSLPGVVGGNAAAGLAEPGLAEPGPADLAPAALVWVCLVLVEGALLIATTWGGVIAYKRGPGRMKGMASAAEAEKLLGVTRLRKGAPIVRPDLYGKHAQPATPVLRDVGDPEDSKVKLGRGLSPWLSRGASTTRSCDEAEVRTA
jgi:hypothetical protein